jgi:hypothetical protein
MKMLFVTGSNFGFFNSLPVTLRPRRQCGQGFQFVTLQG